MDRCPTCKPFYSSPDQLVMDLQGNYTIVDGSEYGLKEALFTKGGTLFDACMRQDQYACQRSSICCHTLLQVP